MVGLSTKKQNAYGSPPRGYPGTVVVPAAGESQEGMGATESALSCDQARCCVPGEGALRAESADRRRQEDCMCRTMPSLSKYLNSPPLPRAVLSLTRCCHEDHVHVADGRERVQAERARRAQ